EAWQYEITGLWLPEDVANGERLGLGIGDLGRFAELVLLPKIVSQRERNCFVSYDDDHAAILCGCAGARVRHQENHRTQERKHAVRLEDVENGAMLSLDSGEPRIRIFRIRECSRGLGGFGGGHVREGKRCYTNRACPCCKRAQKSTAARAATIRSTGHDGIGLGLRINSTPPVAIRNEPPARGRGPHQRRRARSSRS